MVLSILTVNASEVAQPPVVTPTATPVQSPPRVTTPSPPPPGPVPAGLLNNPWGDAELPLTEEQPHSDKESPRPPPVWVTGPSYTHTHTFILHVRTRYRPRITALFNSAIFVWSCSFIPIMQNRTVIYTYILSIATDECTKECMHWCILEAMIMFPVLPAVPPDRPQCLQGHHFYGLWLVLSGEWMAENSRHSSEVVVWNHSSPCCCPDELLTVLNHVPSNIIHSGKTWRAFKRLFWANN